MPHRVFISMLYCFLVAGCTYAVALSSIERQFVPSRRKIGACFWLGDSDFSRKFKQCLNLELLFMIGPTLLCSLRQAGRIIRKRRATSDKDCEECEAGYICTQGDPHPQECIPGW